MKTGFETNEEMTSLTSRHCKPAKQFGIVLLVFSGLFRSSYDGVKTSQKQ